MTLQFVDTPLAAAVSLPEPRASEGFDLAEAVFPESRKAVHRLREPGALAVTTGQQPGLFAGPLYTFHKALSARAVAHALERRWQRTVVPIFWVAGDDHDYAEASHTAWLGADGGLVTAQLPPRPPDAPLTPMYREPVPDTIIELIDRFAQTVPTGQWRDGALAWLRRHYRPGASLAGAFGGALAELLGDLGIVCVDASAAGLKRRAWPVLRTALRHSDSLQAMLVQRADALIAAGRDPGVKVGDGATLVMLEAAAGRDRLLPDGDGFVTRRSGERFSLDDLEQIATREPERFSANVLLRPVIESAVLPTVAYVAGPGEIRYLDLAAELYGPLEVPRQLPLPRWSGLIVEPRVSRTLDKLGLTVSQVLEEGRRLDQRLAREAIPQGFDAALRSLRATLDTGYEALAAEIRAIDPTLEKPARTSLGQALGSLAELEKRVVQAVKRRQTEAVGQLERVHSALQPGDKPQERVLGMAGFLARYGLDGLSALAEHVERWYQRALEATATIP